MKKHPKFTRQEYHRYKKLKNVWRRPKGHHSKLREHRRYRPSSPRIGYGNKKEARGRHPCGMMERLISNIGDLDLIKSEVGRIAGAVGGKKRIVIRARAKELGIKLLN